ncbi:ABC transporter ATP-binding protein [Ornithinimicrobium cerasi]|uniref:ABC transporter ATP-binding protein n=1 Tax=Ornithinimicrobium cerasi TaxID=2248773 RepID=UPI00137A993D|nr:ABC transporter ATP-binding protein [Ornithinimicrobium cerasi]
MSVGLVLMALMDTFAIALVLPMVTMAVGERPPGVVQSALDNLGVAPENAILPLIIAVVALFILKDVLAVTFNWWNQGFIGQQRAAVASRLLRHYLTSSYTDVSRRGQATLMNRLNTATFQVFGLVINAGIQLFSHAFNIFAIAAALIILAPLPSLVLMATTVLFSIVYLRVVRPHAARAGKEMDRTAVAAWRSAMTALGAMKELHLRGTQQRFVDQYRLVSNESVRASQVASLLAALPRYLLETLFILVLGTVLAFSVAREANLLNSFGVLALFVAAALRLLPAISGLLACVSSVRVGEPFVEILREELAGAQVLSPATPTKRQEGPVLPLRAELSLAAVTFSYPGAARPALRDVSLTFRAGTQVAIVGGSGAGKTTLVDVVLGLHQPTMGQVRVDGRDIRDALDSWQRGIAYVPQDVYLFEGSLLENITVDEDPEDVDGPRLQEAIDRAMLTDLVSSLEAGLDTELGDRGGGLSGGQKQRLGIARALYLDPQLIVMDEGTSSLDNETESHITEALRALKGRITVIIVAHRLSTVRHADHVVVMRDGVVEAQGTFAWLRENNPYFARLIALGDLSGKSALPEPIPGRLS